MQDLDSLDKKLLDLVQTQVPLVERPFLHLADQLGVTEAEILHKVSRFRSKTASNPPIIRQISAIFDSKSLGYQTTLVAAQVAESNLEKAVAVINRHPGVSHNYLRNHKFNLWYTLAVPPDSGLGLDGTLAVLHRESGAISTRMLPTEKLFKIGVKFDLSGEGDITARTTGGGYQRGEEVVLTEEDKVVIRLLQQDLPLVSEPFAEWAAEAGMTVRELLNRAQGFIDSKVMRRFSAVLRHREAGISANAMGVWVVPEAKRSSFGEFAGSFGAVSHCYLRKTYPDWPYSIFTMVHAPTREQCEAVLKRISDESGMTEYAALYSTKEYKKVRVQYFTPEIGEWEKVAKE